MTCATCTERRCGRCEREPTLTEALAARGLTHRPSPGLVPSRREVVDAGGVVFAGKAGEVWMWLREQP